jgi:oxygen-dependent protoporphyrinogen oxidase
LTSPILSLKAKLRLLGEPFSKRAPQEDESIAAFVRRRLGPDVAERVVDAVMGGIYAGDIESLSIRSALPKIYELERRHGGLLRGAMAMGKERRKERQAAHADKAPAPAASRRLLGFRHGLGQLAAAIGEAITAAGGRIVLGTPARALMRNGPRWLVRTDQGEWPADAVLLCLPPPQAQALLRPVDAVLAEAYAGIPMAPIAAVCLGYQRAEVPHPLDGFGFLVPRREDLPLLGALFMTSILPGCPQAPEGHVLVRAMYGGATNPGILEQDDHALSEQARRDLQKTLGIKAAPRFRHVQRWTRAIEQYVLGHGDRVATIEGRAAGTGLFFAGAALHGISVPDVLKDGEAAAERLWTALHP